MRLVGALVVCSLLCVSSGAVLEGIEQFVEEDAAVETLAAIRAASETEELASRLSKDDGAMELSFAVERGWWRLAEQLLAVYREARIDLSGPMYQAASKVKRRLQKLQDSFLDLRFANRYVPCGSASPGSNHSHCSIAPAFRWAQSPSAVFLEQKFSHKWDTPATLGCKQERFHVQGASVSFDVLCREKRKRFQLALELHREVDPEVRMMVHVMVWS
jgi:hypothetical protein